MLTKWKLFPSDWPLLPLLASLYWALSAKNGTDSWICLGPLTWIPVCDFRTLQGGTTIISDLTYLKPNSSWSKTPSLRFSSTSNSFWVFFFFLMTSVFSCKFRVFCFPIGFLLSAFFPFYPKYSSQLFTVNVDSLFFSLNSEVQSPDLNSMAIHSLATTCLSNHIGHHFPVQILFTQTNFLIPTLVHPPGPQLHFQLKPAAPSGMLLLHLSW